MELVSVAAVAENGVIGREGELPWASIPADKSQYRARIADGPVIMGRRTFESMLDDLPGAVHTGGVEAAIDRAQSFDSECSYVIGGGMVYECFQPRLDRMVLSRVHGTYEGDSHYPDWSPEEWELAGETTYDRFTLEEWRRH